MRARGLLINFQRNLSGHVNMVIERIQRCSNSTTLENCLLIGFGTNGKVSLSNTHIVYKVIKFHTKIKTITYRIIMNKGKNKHKINNIKIQALKRPNNRL